MRILIVRLGAIGDIVHTLPALAALRQGFPDSHLGWIVQAGAGASLLKDNPYLDEIIELDRPKSHADPSEPVARGPVNTALSRLRGSRYDLAIDFQGLYKSALLPWLARIPRRIGFGFSSLRERGAGIFLTERVETSDNQHIIEKNLQLPRALGCETGLPYQFPIQTSLSDRAAIAEEVDRAGEGFAVINPGGGWPTKLWKPRYFAEIADRLWQHHQVRSIITIGPGEDALAKEIEHHSQTGRVRSLRISLKEFYLLARHARLFVGGDTGPMHLAGAAGTPIVALFGPSSSRRNGPFRTLDLVVERHDLECRVNCYRRRCGHTSCMDIPTSVVWEAIEKRLRSEQGQQRTEADGKLRTSPNV